MMLQAQITSVTLTGPSNEGSRYYPYLHINTLGLGFRKRNGKYIILTRAKSEPQQLSFFPKLLQPPRSNPLSKIDWIRYHVV